MKSKEIEQFAKRQEDISEEMRSARIQSLILIAIYKIILH